jgi:carbon starvation protein CstA
MKIKTKEIIWPIATLIISFILFNPSLKIDNFTNESTVDINIHNTYLVVYNRLFLFATITILFFSVYLIRMLRRKFNNLIANYIFMIANLCFIYMLYYILSIIKLLSTSSSILLEQKKEFEKPNLTIISIIISLIVVEIVVAYITRIKYKQHCA